MPTEHYYAALCFFLAAAWSGYTAGRRLGHAVAAGRTRPGVPSDAAAAPATTRVTFTWRGGQRPSDPWDACVQPPPPQAGETRSASGRRAPVPASAPAAPQDARRLTNPKPALPCQP